MYNRTIAVDTLVTLKKPNARNLLIHFLAPLDRKNPAVCIMGAAKTKCKAIMTYSALLYIIHKRRGNTKIKCKFKRNTYIIGFYIINRM